jgi:hypothetical protein
MVLILLFYTSLTVAMVSDSVPIWLDLIKIFVKWGLCGINNKVRKITQVVAA